MSEVKAFSADVVDGNFEFSVDSNKDGESSLKGKLGFGEAFQEAFKKGEAVPGVKVVDFEFQLTKLVLKLDTDRDGESMFELELDLAEVADEIKSLL